MPGIRVIQVQDETQGRLDEKQDVLPYDNGIMVDFEGIGSPHVSTLVNYAYVVIGNEESTPVKVLNRKAPFVTSLPVLVGVDPIDGQYQVMGQRTSAYIDSGQTPYPDVGAHHESHEFEAYGVGGGYDLVWPSFEQVTTLMVRAAADLGAFWVRLHEGPMPRQSGWEWISAAGGYTVTLNLAADVPGAGGRMALIYIDAAGDLQRRLSALVPLAALDITDTPAPLAGEYPVAAVRLYSGQTQLTDNFITRDITQLRYPQFAGAGDWIHDHSNNANGGNALAHLTHTPATAFVATYPDNVNPAATFVDAGGIEYLRFNTLNAQPVLTVNEGGADVDTRIEASGHPNTLFIEGSSGDVGIGTVPTGRLTIQGDTGASVGVGLYAGDGDGTDFVSFVLYAVGTPGNIVNRERLIMQYDQVNTRFLLLSEAGGTGTLRSLDLETEGNTHQLRLATDGTVGVFKDTPSARFHVRELDASTNTSVEVARLEIESSSGAGAAGLGPALRFTAEDADSNLNQNVAQIAGVWESTAAAGTDRGQFRMFTALNGTLYTTGVIVAPDIASTEPAAGAWGLGAVDFQTWRNNVAEVAAGNFSTISGGRDHRIAVAASLTTICGGEQNAITAGSYGIVLGGLSNTVAASWGVAAGQAATVNHTGAMVFAADLAGTGFASDYNDQFKVITHGMFVLSGDNAIGRALFHLHQTDENEPFVHYDGSGANDCSLNISDLTPTFTLVGYVRIQITDDNAVVANGDYWMPFYSCTP